mmetsp:Transcript_12206/g.24831  ORF Transcript_12206/g.24831 Transcript_12206/m.24831 type:complete len:356 (+) Transcript_12206:762-1829(+)
MHAFRHPCCMSWPRTSCTSAILRMASNASSLLYIASFLGPPSFANSLIRASTLESNSLTSLGSFCLEAAMIWSYCSSVKSFPLNASSLSFWTVTTRFAATEHHASSLAPDPSAPSGDGADSTNSFTRRDIASFTSVRPLRAINASILPDFISSKAESKTPETDPFDTAPILQLMTLALSGNLASTTWNLPSRKALTEALPFSVASAYSTTLTASSLTSMSSSGARSLLRKWSPSSPPARYAPTTALDLSLKLPVGTFSTPSDSGPSTPNTASTISYLPLRALTMWPQTYSSQPFRSATALAIPLTSSSTLFFLPCLSLIFSPLSLTPSFSSEGSGRSARLHSWSAAMQTFLLEAM